MSPSRRAVRRLRSSSSTRRGHQRELEALRLALLLLAAVVSASDFPADVAPFTDLDAGLAWLRRQLGPLACRADAIRDALGIVAVERRPRLWNDPRWARRELRRLAAQVRRLDGD